MRRNKVFLTIDGIDPIMDFLSDRSPCTESAACFHRHQLQISYLHIIKKRFSFNETWNRIESKEHQVVKEHTTYLPAPKSWLWFIFQHVSIRGRFPVHHPLPNEQDRATDRSRRHTLQSLHLLIYLVHQLGQPKTALLKQATNQGIAGQVPTIKPHFAFDDLLQLME